MPDFFPAPQLPQGLAEEVLRLASQRGQNNPWVAALQAASQTAQGYASGRQRSAENFMTPQQANSLAPAPGMLPSGVAGPQPRPTFDPAQFKRVPVSLVEQMSKQREAEALNRMTTERMIGVQGIKGNQSMDAKDLQAQHAKELEDLKAKHAQELAGIKGTISKDAKAQTLNVRDQQFWEKQWVDTGKDMDLGKASSRSPLGVAVSNNMKAGRALKLLDAKLKDQKYKFTPQDLSLITTDLTAMMKGGSPDEELLRQQQYGNISSQATGLIQRLSSSPQDLNVPEVKQHLRDIIKSIVEVDNQVINDHVSSVESTRADVIGKRPKDWEKIKAKALSHVQEESSLGAIKFDAVISEVLGAK